jgi:hypothetical protein
MLGIFKKETREEKIEKESIELLSHLKASYSDKEIVEVLNKMLQKHYIFSTETANYYTEVKKEIEEFFNPK